MPTQMLRTVLKDGPHKTRHPGRVWGSWLADCFNSRARGLALAAAGAALLWFASGSAMAQIAFDPATYKQLAPASSSETIPVGTRIDPSNWTTYKKFLPLGVQALFSGKYMFRMGTDPGFAIEVGPTQHIPLPSKVVRDTEKHSGQVRLKDLPSGGKGTEGYVAGEPFPNPTDPDLAYKIIYDNWYRWYPFVQTFHSHTRLVDRFQNISYQMSQTTYWRLSHLSDDDYPTTMPYAAGFALNARFFLLAPEQTKYTTEIEMLHDDPTVVPELYVFLPSLRRSLRTIVSASVRSAGVGGSGSPIAGRNSRRTATISSTASTPTDARRNRGASARN